MRKNLIYPTPLRGINPSAGGVALHFSSAVLAHRRITDPTRIVKRDKLPPRSLVSGPSDEMNIERSPKWIIKSDFKMCPDPGCAKYTPARALLPRSGLSRRAVKNLLSITRGSTDGTKNRGGRNENRPLKPCKNRRSAANRQMRRGHY